MMTAESMLSKRSVLRFTVALLFLLTLFSSRVNCIKLIENVQNVLSIIRSCFAFKTKKVKQYIAKSI